MNIPGISEPRPPDRDRADELRRRDRVKHEHVRAARAFVIRTEAAEAVVEDADVRTTDAFLADRLRGVARSYDSSSSSLVDADGAAPDAASELASIGTAARSLATGRSADQSETAESSDVVRGAARASESSTTHRKDSVRAEAAHAEAVREVAACESHGKGVGEAKDEREPLDVEGEGKPDVGLVVVVTASPLPPESGVAAPPAVPAGLSRADFGRLLRFAEMGRDAQGRNELRVGFGSAVLGGVEVFVTSLGPRRVSLRLRGSGVAGEEGLRHADDLRASLERRGLEVDGCVTEAEEC